MEERLRSSEPLLHMLENIGSDLSPKKIHNCEQAEELKNLSQSIHLVRLV